MLRWLRRLAAPVVAVALLGFVGTRAYADSILYTFGSLSKTPVGANTKWTYEVDLTAGSILTTGDYFVILDFGGYVPGTVLTTAPGWSAAAELTTGSPAGTIDNGLSGSLAQSVSAPDSATSWNLRFTYTGAASGPAHFASFSAVTTLTGQVDGSLLAKDHTSGNIARVNSDSVPVPVPLPATANMGLVLLGGVGGIGAFRRMKNRRDVIA